MGQKVGKELNIIQLAAKCINRGDVEYYRYICRTEDGRYVWIESGDDNRPGFAVWYNDAVVARRELGVDDDLFDEERTWEAEMRLCAEGDLAVLKASVAEGRVYLFKGLGKAARAWGVELFDTLDLWLYLARRDRRLLKLIVACDRDSSDAFA